MALLPIREAAMRAIATALATAGVPVERNRRAALDPKEFPRLVLLDSGHTAQDQQDPGMVTYTLGVAIEGYVKASEAQMGAALSDLHAKVCLAIVGRALTFGNPADQLWLTETRMEPETAALSQAEGGLGNFTVEFECELRSSLADGPFINA